MTFVNAFHIKNFHLDNEVGSRRTQLFYSFAFNSHSQCHAINKFDISPCAFNDEELVDFVNEKYYDTVDLDEMNSAISINNCFPQSKDLLENTIRGR